MSHKYVNYLLFRDLRALKRINICKNKFSGLLSTSKSNVLRQEYYSSSRSIKFFKIQNSWNNLFGIRSYAAGFPKHVKVTLPALSPTMEKGTLIKWTKNEGDKLNEGDLLAEIETDKATMGFETPEEGYLARILIPPNTKDIPLGKLLCIIVYNEADVQAFKTYQPSDDSLRGDAYPSQIIDALKTQGAQSTTASAAPTQASAPPPSQPMPQATKKYPKHLKVMLPSLSPTMEKGNIYAWLVNEGDQLKEGDVLAQIETDKATMDFETPEEGYLAKIGAPAGTKGINVGAFLCVIVPNKEDVAAFKDYVPPPEVTQTESTPTNEPPKASTPTVTPTPAQTPTAAPPVPSMAPSVATPSGGVAASPLAKKLAADKGIDLKLIKGTGPHGSVTAHDVKSYEPPAKQASVTPAQQPAPISKIQMFPQASFIDIPLTSMRQVIAKRLFLSKTTVPHYYLSIDINMDKIIKLRKEMNEMLVKDKIKISVNDFIIKAAALACVKVPEANSSWQDTFIRKYNNVDINVAVATESGLITPIVFSADKKGLATICSDVQNLAEKAREGKLQPQEFQGGTFTISNLGMYGIKNFSAIINPPQACILAVGGSVKQVVPDTAGTGFSTSNMMSVTLSCDHRVVDGAVGSTWLEHFKKLLERPEIMLI